MSTFDYPLSNLLDNACNYTPTGTPITIRASIMQQTLHLTICDHGTGLPEEDLPRIFDKFYRVPGTRTGGTGLGLSIARGIIEAHGRQLTVTNRTEGGPCFTIELPMHGKPTVVEEAKHEQ